MASPGAKNNRCEERVPAALLVSLERGTGITRNVSASGMYFETDVNFAPGNEISFSIDLDGPRGKMMLKGRGRLVRVEDRRGKVGVATKIIESRLEMLKDSGKTS